VQAVGDVNAAEAVAGDQLTNLKLFDVYHSKDVENKGKSVALGLDVSAQFTHSYRRRNQSCDRSGR